MAIARPAVKRRVSAHVERVEQRLLFAVTFVDPNAPDGGDGTSWAQAFNNLHVAIANSGNNAEIRLAGGTYAPTTTTDRTRSFAPRSGQTLTGGYAGFDAPNPDLRNETTLLTGVIAASNRAYNIMVLDATPGVTLVGIQFSLSQPNGTGLGQDRGGGLRITGSADISLVDCRFSGHSSESSYGAAVFIDANSSATVSRSTFDLNTALAGAAIFSDSPAVVVSDTVFRDNAVVSFGGAMVINGNGPNPLTRIERSTFSGNRSADSAGALYLAGNKPVQIINSLFVGNRSVTNGGAIENLFGTQLSVFNSTFTLNQSQAVGGAINTFQASLVAESSIFWGNTATSGGGQLFTFEGTTPLSSSSVTESIVAGGFVGEGNLDADPLFVRPASRSLTEFDEGDLRLQLGSPALNSGTNPLNLTTDLSNSPRVQDSTIDRGAYEGGVDVTPPVSTFNPVARFRNSASVFLSWGATDDSGLAVTYTVFRSINSGAFTAILTDVTTTNLTDTLANTSGTTHGYYVVAKDAVGNTEVKMMDPEVITTLDLVAPTVTLPMLPEFNASPTFQVSWGGSDALSGVATYTVIVRDNTGFLPNLRTDSPDTSASFTGTPGKTYTFRIIATDVTGNSSPNEGTADVSTTIDTAAPTSQLSNLAPRSSASGVDLFWGGNDSGSGVASYSVFVSQNNAPFTPLLTNTTLTTTFFPGIEGSTYRFYVVARDAVGNTETKPAAAETTVLFDRTAPVVTLPMLPEFTNQATFTVAWGATDTLDTNLRYTVFVRENGSFIDNLRTNSTDTSASFTGTPGNTYTFRIVARDSAGNFSPNETSAESSTTIDTAAPTSAVAALPDFTRALTIPLNWAGTDGVSGVASYSLFVSADGGPFTAVLSNTTLTQFNFPAEDNRTYRFFTRATDRAGNVEPEPTTPDATTFVQTDIPLLTETGTGAETDANLVFDPITLRLPKPILGAVVGGSVLKGSLRVRNLGPGVAIGGLSVQLVLSSDGNVSSKDTQLITVSPRRALNLKARGTVSIPFTLTLPSNISGDVQLLAFANSTALVERTTLDNVRPLATFTLARPVLNLTSGTLTAASPRKGRALTATLTITNNSNVAFNGTLPLVATLLDSQGNTVSETTISPKARLATGKFSRLRIKLAAPFPTESGTYTLRTRLDPVSTLSQSPNDDLSTLTFTLT